MPGPEQADHRLLLDTGAGTPQVQVRKALDPVRLDVRGASYRPDQDEEHDTLEVRLPWSMLDMADPSSRLALGEGIPAERVTVPGIGLALEVDGEPHRLDLSWPTWNRVEYTTRLKAGAEDLAAAYAELAP